MSCMAEGAELAEIYYGGWFLVEFGVGRKALTMRHGSIWYCAAADARSKKDVFLRPNYLRKFCICADYFCFQ